MNPDQLVSHTASIVLKTLIKIGLLLVLGGLVCLVLAIILLAQLRVCTTEFFACGLVVSALILLSLVVPLLLLWGARGYVLMKVLYDVYHANEAVLLQHAAIQICHYRRHLMAYENIKGVTALKKLPLPVRLLLRKLDLSSLSEVLKAKPHLTPVELVPFLQERVKMQGFIQKPSLAWYWGLMLLVISVFTVLWWWL